MFLSCYRAWLWLISWFGVVKVVPVGRTFIRSNGADIEFVVGAWDTQFPTGPANSIWSSLTLRDRMTDSWEWNAKQVRYGKKTSFHSGFSRDMFYLALNTDTSQLVEDEDATQEEN